MDRLLKDIHEQSEEADDQSEEDKLREGETDRLPEEIGELSDETDEQGEEIDEKSKKQIN